MKNYVWRKALLLLLTATIWGVAFVAQSVGMDYVGAFTFNAVRNVIGGLVLIPTILLFDRKSKGVSPDTKSGSQRKHTLIAGIWCGVCLFVASTLQQIGIQYTTVGKAGFITAMYIVLVPLLGIFLHKKVGFRVWLAVAIAVVGLYVLCVKPGEFSVQMGDLLVLLCAVAFSVHIMVIDHFAPTCNGVKMSCIQFFTCAVLSSIGMFLFETPEIDSILQAWIPILYAGALSSGVGYTLQIVGQKGMNPTVASLILSLESTISVIAGWLILGQELSARELIGCAMVMIAIVIVISRESQEK